MWITDGPNSSFLVYNCFLYVGIEPRDLDMLGKHSITEGCPQPYIRFIWGQCITKLPGLAFKSLCTSGSDVLSVKCISDYVKTKTVRQLPAIRVFCHWVWGEG